MAATGGTATAGIDLLPSLVDALVGVPLDGLDAGVLQERIAAVTPQVHRLQGWLLTAAGRLEHTTGGTLPTEVGRPRSVAGWLADVQHATAGAAGSQLRTARLLQDLPLVVAAVLDGLLTPAQAAVLTRLVGRIEPSALLESQPHLIEVAAAMDPVQLGQWVAHQIATHCEPASSPSRPCATAPCPTPQACVRSCSTSCPPTGPPPSSSRPPAPRADRAARTTSRAHGDTVEAALPGHGGLRAEQACATAAWSGPQTRARIEALLCDARITRVLLTPSGQVRGFQPLRDGVTPAQRRALAARDLGCAARGCTRPPAMCDAHHLHHRANGGTTTMDDLELLCRRHHVQWHQGTLGLHHLTIGWHPDQQTAPPPTPLDDLFRADP